MADLNEVIEEETADKMSYTQLILMSLSDHTRNSSLDVDFSQPYIKPNLRYVYPLFVSLNFLVSAFGIVHNLAIIGIIVTRRLWKESPTFLFFANLALSDVIKVAIAQPLTVINLIMQNWILGSFLCYFLPMLHAFPIHATMMTHVVIAIDRYRFIVHPMKSRIPAGLCIIAVWVAAVCIVIPFTVYTRYIDLGSILGEKFDGVGICQISLDKPAEQYIRAMFISLTCMPLAVIAFLHVRISMELKAQPLSNPASTEEDRVDSDTENTVQQQQQQHQILPPHRILTPGNSNCSSLVTQTTDASNKSRRNTTFSDVSSPCREYPPIDSSNSLTPTLVLPACRYLPPNGPCRSEAEVRLSIAPTTTAASTGDYSSPVASKAARRSITRRMRKRYERDIADELNKAKERRTQKYLVTMVLLFAACWTPLNILILVTHFIYENEANTGHFDVTFLTFTFFGYLSACLNGPLFASWYMSKNAKEKLRGYFRLSNRSNSASSGGGGHRADSIRSTARQSASFRRKSSISRQSPSPNMS